ncbi:MAG: protoglobin domain-containing protein [Thiolinea sp.]
MTETDFTALCTYARHFSRLDDDKIATLHGLYADIQPRIPAVTDAFYTHLQTIPKTAPFLEGRLESLKKTHQDWTMELFTSAFDSAYTERLYRVGDIHVKIKLPVEFMAGAIFIIQSELMKQFQSLYGQDPVRLLTAADATNSATGFSLLIMQESFQSSTLVSELDNFLKITGMSRKLFNNLAMAYR